MRCLWLVTVLAVSSCTQHSVPGSYEELLEHGDPPPGCADLDKETYSRLSKKARSFFDDNIGIEVKGVTLDQGYDCKENYVFHIKATANGEPHENDWFVQIKKIDEENIFLMRPE